MSELDGASESAGADSPEAAPDVEARADRGQPTEQYRRSSPNPDILILQGNGFWEVLAIPESSLVVWWHRAIFSCLLLLNVVYPRPALTLVCTGIALAMNAATALDLRSPRYKIERLIIGEQYCTIERTEGRGWWREERVRLQRSQITSLTLEKVGLLTGELEVAWVCINLRASEGQMICSSVKSALREDIAWDIAQLLGVPIRVRETRLEPGPGY